MMRCLLAEKPESIDRVKHPALHVGRTLGEQNVPRSSVYRWYPLLEHAEHARRLAAG